MSSYLYRQTFRPQSQDRPASGYRNRREQLPSDDFMFSVAKWLVMTFCYI